MKLPFRTHNIDLCPPGPLLQKPQNEIKLIILEMTFKPGPKDHKGTGNVILRFRELTTYVYIRPAYGVAITNNTQN